MEVLNVDVLVGRRLALAPQQETLLGCHFLDGNVLNGEAQDDRPDHAQRHLQVAVNDFLGTDRHQLDALRRDKVQSFVHVGDLRVGGAFAIKQWQRLSHRASRPTERGLSPCGNAFCRGRAWAGSRPK